MPGRSMRGALRTLQADGCIYSSRELPVSSSLDHVLPWSKTRLATIENFVLTSKSTNSQKGNLLLGPRGIHAWRSHLDKNGAALHDVAAREGWISDIQRTIEIARGFYEAALPETPVWDYGEGVFSLGDDQARVIEMLS